MRRLAEARKTMVIYSQYLLVRRSLLWSCFCILARTPKDSTHTLEKVANEALEAFFSLRSPGRRVLNFLMIFVCPIHIQTVWQDNELLYGM